MKQRSERLLEKIECILKAGGWYSSHDIADEMDCSLRTVAMLLKRLPLERKVIKGHGIVSSRYRMKESGKGG